MQKGDVPKTSADISKAQKLLDYKPLTKIEKEYQSFRLVLKNIMIIDLDINRFSLLVTLVSLTFLVIVNSSQMSIYKKTAINSLMFCEGITLTFFFGKFPFVLSSLIVVLSLYFINISKVLAKEHSRQNILLSFASSGSKSKLFGTGVVLLVLIYEFFADNEYSSTSLLFTIIGSIFIMILYQKNFLMK